ncbi:ribbon-helix-helix domain-containing protein [Rickettsia sp. TH2014]|uniref:ribbon-helix-helix domain-containing protein n=1 Tax=Rickettsia sp. TH2014 TaxID=1967503 RepID=UPI001C43FCD6|nr:ribbon-helix-helix domain-containing protein [Rickettsia sp. TH2014]
MSWCVINLNIGQKMARPNLTIPDELNDSLTCSAKSLDRSKGYIARKAIEYYLKEIQEVSEDAKIALQRINAPDFKTYTTDEVREWLKKKNV